MLDVITDVVLLVVSGLVLRELWGWNALGRKLQKLEREIGDQAKRAP